MHDPALHGDEHHSDIAMNTLNLAGHICIVYVAMYMIIIQVITDRLMIAAVYSF